MRKATRRIDKPDDGDENGNSERFFSDCSRENRAKKRKIGDKIPLPPRQGRKLDKSDGKEDLLLPFLDEQNSNKVRKAEDDEWVSKRQFARRKNSNGRSEEREEPGEMMEYVLGSAVLNDDIQEKATELHGGKDVGKMFIDKNNLARVVDSMKNRSYAARSIDRWNGISGESEKKPGRTVIVDTISDVGRTITPKKEPDDVEEEEPGTEEDEEIQRNILKKTLEMVSGSKQQAEADIELLKKNNVKIKRFEHVNPTQQEGIIQKIRDRLLENFSLFPTCAEKGNNDGGFPISVHDNIKKTKKDHWESIMDSFHMQTEEYLSSRREIADANTGDGTFPAKRIRNSKDTGTSPEKEGKGKGGGGAGPRYDQNMCPKIPILEREYCCQFLRSAVKELGERDCHAGDMCQSYVLSKELLENTLSVSGDKKKCSLYAPFRLREFVLPEELKSRMEALGCHPETDPSEVINEFFENRRYCLLCYRYIVHRNAIERVNNGGNTTKGPYVLQQHGNSFSCQGGYIPAARLNAGQSFVGIIVPVLRFDKTDYLFSVHNVYYKQSQKKPSIIQKISKESQVLGSNHSEGETNEDEIEMKDEEVDGIEAEMLRNPESVERKAKQENEMEEEEEEDIASVEVNGWIENPKIIFKNANNQKGLNMANSFADRLNYNNLS